MNFSSIENPEQLMKYLDQNIFYGFVSKDNDVYTIQDEKWNNDWYDKCLVQSPENLINSGYGTCWDQVELERDWFNKNKYQFKTIFLIFNFNEQHDAPTHTALIYHEKEKWYWFEHSWEDERGIHEFNTYESAVAEIKEKHLKYAVEYNFASIEDIKYLECYEYSKPAPNIGVAEYLNHVISGKKL